MIMLRWMIDNTLKDRITNGCTCGKFKVARVEDKTIFSHLFFNWYHLVGHVQHRPVDAPVRMSEKIVVKGDVRIRGRTKKNMDRNLKNDRCLLV